MTMTPEKQPSPREAQPGKVELRGQTIVASADINIDPQTSPLTLGFDGDFLADAITLHCSVQAGKRWPQTKFDGADVRALRDWLDYSLGWSAMRAATLQG